MDQGFDLKGLTGWLTTYQMEQWDRVTCLEALSWLQSCRVFIEELGGNMRISREKVEQLMQFQWEKGYETGVADGQQRSVMEAGQREKSHTTALAHIEDALEAIEGKKSVAG